MKARERKVPPFKSNPPSSSLKPLDPNNPPAVTTTGGAPNKMELKSTMPPAKPATRKQKKALADIQSPEVARHAKMGGEMYMAAREAESIMSGAYGKLTSKKAQGRVANFVAGHGMHPEEALRTFMSEGSFGSGLY